MSEDISGQSPLFAYCNRRTSCKHRFFYKVSTVLNIRFLHQQATAIEKDFSVFPVEHVCLFCYSLVTKVDASESFTALLKSLQSRTEGHKTPKGLTK